ncbi:tyrosine-type recombinase/integrase [Massilia sp. YIM B02769]|uniref:tyrosine-type recombinase/integrase n=1 Tax=Massilia sp. YIM B02769 TaxID=3050129 RepID=UPI0025B6D1ED|nr:site-specific integrase [Massilia sp. YIM B02769]MDN4060358.1 tyrosine-type recombinase/integrase [Massilia sp. YIM B02769]
MQLRRWIAADVPIAKSDGGGLTFTLSKGGTASWVLRYMRDGKAKELTLGNYPDLALSAARKLAAEHRVSVDKGEDPAAQKRAERLKSRAAWTVRELAADFREKALHSGTLAKATVYYREWDLDTVILPRLGPVEVRSVTAEDVVDLLERSGRTWTMQKRILTTTVQLFDHAIGRQLIKVNPAGAIKLKALLGPRPAVRKRLMLTEAELRTLLASIDDIGRENALAFRILLATCVRTVELVKARWEHVDFDRGTWYVPDESVKTRTGFLVPLTPTVAEWFKELKRLAEDSPWVLPARDRRRTGEHVGRTTLWAAIERAFVRDEIEIRRFTPHDTRSTAKGHMRNMGVSREISEIALNHALKGMEAIYDVREEIPERRRALELWASFLEACEQGRQWNVVPLVRPAA